MFDGRGPVVVYSLPNQSYKRSSKGSGVRDLSRSRSMLFTFFSLTRLACSDKIGWVSTWVVLMSTFCAKVQVRVCQIRSLHSLSPQTLTSGHGCRLAVTVRLSMVGRFHRTSDILSLLLPWQVTLHRHLTQAYLC